MSRLGPIAGLVATVMCASLARAATADLVQPRPGEVPVPLTGLPTTAALGQYRLIVRLPEHAEDSALGGSGGPILELVVAGPRFEAPEVIRIQAIQLYARDMRPDPPEFNVWSKTGVSNLVRCSLGPIGPRPRYCLTTCQDYEIDTRGMVPAGKPRPQPPCQ